MRFLKIEIPSYILPKERYKLNDGIYVFSSESNKKEETIDFYGINLTLIFTEESGILDDTKAINQQVKAFILFLNFISYSPQSAIWLQSVNSKELYKQIESLDKLESIFEKYEEKEKTQLSQFYCDYQNLALQINLPRDEYQIYENFITLFRKYIELKDSNTLKQRIDLLSFTSVQSLLTNKFYDNQNIEIGMVYTLVDSIIKETISKEAVVKKCEECGFEKKGKKRDKARIKEYVQSLNSDNSELWEKIIMNLYKIRNEFFHEGKASTFNETSKQAFDKKFKDSGNRIIFLEEEVVYNESSFLGLINIKMLVREKLIENLKNCP
jgi:hypothetical protein